MGKHKANVINAHIILYCVSVYHKLLLRYNDMRKLYGSV